MAGKRLAAAVAIAAWATLLIWPAALAATTPSPSATPTPDPQQACQSIPPLDPIGRISCDVVTGGPGGPARDIQQSASQAAGQAGQAAADAAETALTRWLANGAAWVVQGVTQMVVGNSTTPSLDPAQAGMFTQVYGRVVGVALSLSVLLVLVGIIEATLTQRPGGYRRVVTGIAVAGIGVGAVPAATAILVRITDDLSSYVAAGQSQEVAQGLSAVVHLLLQTNPAEGAAAFALTALGLMVGGALLWLELVTRESLIYLFLGVVPLACAAVQWPRLEGVLRQVLFGGLALILSKLVIVIALAVGFAILSLDSGLQSLLGGMFILLIASLAPFATARVLPLAAEELSLSHQTRLRGWAMTGVGTTASIVAAIRAGSSKPAAGVRLASAMGSSGGGGTQPGSSGAGGGGPRRPGSGGPSARTPGSSRNAQAAAGGGPAASAAASHTPPPRQPRARGGRPRGPEPPPDAGAPPVT
jgi:hypothetical protein